ncbi:MAG: type II toxin-antitoxin system Phd/YefM family antitoxin [Porphyromonadaceae bacterium]|jgi:hypothetical protein|nr:type II toxin-antitoxin system Phd/YefM family antitoxin [Porphyromonadaceae bacterium]
MLIVSSAEFRANQKTYLDKIDEGAEILIQRGKNKAYRVTPITEMDTVIPQDYILEPDEELANAITFDELLVGVKSDLKDIFQKRKK